jgi:tRNA A-37 threonylcarbamoyl transferase component Bud32
LGLLFRQSLGLIHGHLTGNIIIFNEDGMISMSDFSLHGLADLESDQGGDANVLTFMKILSKMVVGTSTEQNRQPRSIPVLFGR